MEIVHAYIFDEGIANLQLVKVLLNSDVSAYEIESKTGVTRMAISNLRTGKTNIKKIEFMTAIKLTSFSENQIRITATELLDRMKYSNVFEYDIKLDREGKTLLTNADTKNRQSIYNYKIHGEHVYGVYGDLVGGEVDNRTHNDNDILEAITTMLRVGNIIKRR